MSKAIDDYTKLCIAKLEEAAIVSRYENMTDEFKLALQKTLRFNETAAYRSNLENQDEKNH